MPFQPGQSGNPKGRTPKAEKFKRPIAAAERQCADRLKHNVENLQALADGGYERVTERFEPAGLILIELPIRDANGDTVKDADGRVLWGKQRAFPDLAPDAMVLVQRTREFADKDRAANIYLVDRILGKPTQREEHEQGDAAATGPITLEQWKVLANERMAQVEATMAAFEDEPVHLGRYSTDTEERQRP